jgi:hypothetical protein
VDHGLRREASEDDNVLTEQSARSESRAQLGIPLHRDDVAQRDRCFVQPTAAKLVYRSECGESAEDNRQSGSPYDDAPPGAVHEPKRAWDEPRRGSNCCQRIGKTAPGLV